MQQLSKPTFSEQVFELVKQQIRNGLLHPGDRISEVALATECGISRAPVREALYLLETEGFLMTHPKRGRCVTMLTPEGVRNSYELCGVLEGAATYPASLAMSTRDWEALEGVLECMHQNGCGAVDDEEKAELSTVFHNMILKHAANPLLVEVSRRSGRVISKYLMFQQWKTLYSSEEMYNRHLRIFKALQTKDAAIIEQATRNHYAEAGGRMASFLEQAHIGPAERKPKFQLRR